MTSAESKLEPPTAAGINAAIWRANKQDLQHQLSTDPAGTISSRIGLSAADQRLLDAMTPREQAELVAPILEALETDKPFRVVSLDRGGRARPNESQSVAALTKCTITITFEF